MELCKPVLINSLAIYGCISVIKNIYSLVSKKEKKHPIYLDELPDYVSDSSEHDSDPDYVVPNMHKRKLRKRKKII